MKPPLWRVGTKIALNVYEGDRPVCQCHNPEDAQRIVDAMNVVTAMNAGVSRSSIRSTRRNAEMLRAIPPLPPELKLKPGDRVFVTGHEHPWKGRAGELVAFEHYGSGWTGWRVKLDGNCGECYANENELMGPGRVDSIKVTMRPRRRKR